MTELELARACAEKMYANDAASQDLGIEIEISAAGTALARMQVTERMLNGFDVCHGGLIFSLADSAFAFACNSQDEITVAASASVEFLRPAKLGDKLAAHARTRHRGRRAGIYDVEVYNQDEQLVAVFRGRTAALGKPLLGG